MTISGVTSGQQHQRVDGSAPASAPALQAEGQRDAERHGDRDADDRQQQRVLERRLERRVVEDAAGRSPVNQRSENPCQVVRERPSLNANRTAIATGMIDQTM